MEILAAKKMGFIALALCSLSGQPAYAGIPVIDGGNLTQNVLTAMESVAQTLKQVEQYTKQVEQYSTHLPHT